MGLGQEITLTHPLNGVLVDEMNARYQASILERPVESERAAGEAITSPYKKVAIVVPTVRVAHTA